MLPGRRLSRLIIRATESNIKQFSKTLSVQNIELALWNNTIQYYFYATPHSYHLALCSSGKEQDRYPVFTTAPVWVDCESWNASGLKFGEGGNDWRGPMVAFVQLLQVWISPTTLCVEDRPCFPPGSRNEISVSKNNNHLPVFGGRAISYITTTTRWVVRQVAQEEPQERLS